MVILILFTFIATMATRDNFILNVWKSYSEQNYITVKWRKMASLNSLFVGLTVFLSLTSSQNITLSQNQRGEEETSASASQPVQETTETSLERLDDCEEDEWSCHQKGKQSIHGLFNNRIRNISIENQTNTVSGKFLSFYFFYGTIVVYITTVNH